MLWVFRRRCANETPAHDTSADAETEIRKQKKWNKQVRLFHNASRKDARINNKGVYWFNHFPLTFFEPWGRISADKPPVFF